MTTMAKMTTPMGMDTMLKSRLSRKIVSLLAPMKTAVVINKQIICFSSSKLFAVFENPRKVSFNVLLHSKSSLIRIR